MTVSRSYLFVPATRIDRIVKAFASDADAVIIDLEDAVSDIDKPAARSELSRWFDCSDLLDLNPANKPIWVRINNISHHKDTRVNAAEDFHEDIQFCQTVKSKLAGVVLAKVENGESIEHVHQSTGLPVIIQIETATAISNIQALTSKSYIKGLYALSYGTLDLCNELSLTLGSQAQRDFINHLRYQMILMSKANQLKPPIESIYPDFTDIEGLTQTACYTADLGFSGMFTIHPKQIYHVNRAFSANENQLDFARKVVEYYLNTGESTFAIDGVMVDLPAIKQFTRLLE